MLGQLALFQILIIIQWWETGATSDNNVIKSLPLFYFIRNWLMILQIWPQTLKFWIRSPTDGHLQRVRWRLIHPPWEKLNTLCANVESEEGDTDQWGYSWRRWRAGAGGGGGSRRRSRCRRGRLGRRCKPSRWLARWCSAADFSGRRGRSDPERTLSGPEASTPPGNGLRNVWVQSEQVEPKTAKNC